MPTYERRCVDCRLRFETFSSIKDSDAGVACPRCDSLATLKLVSRIAVGRGMSKGDREAAAQAREVQEASESSGKSFMVFDNLVRSTIGPIFAQATEGFTSAIEFRNGSQVDAAGGVFRGFETAIKSTDSNVTMGETYID